MSKEVMKQAMMALEHAADCLDEHQSAYHESIAAIDALCEAIDAEPNIGRTLDQFLCNGTRIKLNFNKVGNMTSLQNMAHDLQGRWVALVPAENDCHLRPAKEPEPLSDARIISLAYDCNAMPESCTDESLKLFAHAIEQEVMGK